MLAGRRLAIFVHGCFWHGHDCARGARVIVRKGLTAGERVITEGIQKIRPGQTVDVTEAGPGPKS